ncbi:unnamed protein product [Discula destructiva]
MDVSDTNNDQAIVGQQDDIIKDQTAPEKSSHNISKPVDLDENNWNPDFESDKGATVGSLDTTALLRQFLATGCPDDIIRHKKTFTRSRKLSIAGRQAVLRSFRQRRPVQREAIINSMLKDLTPEKVHEVYAQVEERKELHMQRLEVMRDIWNLQRMVWCPPSCWGSGGATWSSKTGQGWGDDGKESDEAADEMTDKEPPSWTSDRETWSPGNAQGWEGNDGLLDEAGITNDWGPSPWDTDERSWLPEPSQCWGDTDEVVDGEAEVVEGSEEESDPEPSTWLTDNDEDEQDEDEGTEKQRFVERQQSTEPPDLVLPELNLSISTRYTGNTQVRHNSTTWPESGPDIQLETEQNHTIRASSDPNVNASAELLRKHASDSQNYNGTDSALTPEMELETQRQSSCSLDLGKKDARPAFNGLEDRESHGQMECGSLGTCQPSVPALLCMNSSRLAQLTLSEPGEDAKEHADDLHRDAEMDAENTEAKSGVAPNTAVVSKKAREVADNILPFVMDKDELDFKRTLKESIDIWYDRGLDYMWKPPLDRVRTRPGPTRLRKVLRCRES